MTDNSERIVKRRRTATSGHRLLALDAAMHVASKGGLEAISIGGVAARAALPKATVQTLFTDRAALQIAALDRGIELFATFVSERGPLPDAPLERLSRLLELWFSFVSDQCLPGGCLITSSICEVKARPGVLRDAVLTRAEEWRALVVGLLDAARSTGALASDANPEAIFQDLRAIQLSANLASSLSDESGLARARTRLHQVIDGARLRD